MGHSILVEGEPFPPTMLNSMLSQVLYVVFLLGLVFVFAGQKVVDSLQLRSLQPVVDFVNNNNGTVMILLFLCNMMSSQLIATGAFEVTYNDQMVYSALETHQPPDVEYLIEKARLLLMSRVYIPSSS